MTAREDSVFVVDDDEAVRDSLAALLQASGFRAISFESAVAFLGSSAPHESGCIIADIRMPDMDGLQLQTELRKCGCQMPVIVITGHGDVPLAVKAMKAGAVDFLEKPFDENVLLESIRRALDVSKESPKNSSVSAEVSQKLASLTPREREVLDRVIAGKANKVVAYELAISPRTVEIHRGRLMQKMGARNLAALVRMCLPALNS